MKLYCAQHLRTKTLQTTSVVSEFGWKCIILRGKFQKLSQTCGVLFFVPPTHFSDESYAPVQQSASLAASRTTCCTTDPQLIEVMESDTYAASNQKRSKISNLCHCCHLQDVNTHDAIQMLSSNCREFWIVAKI